MKKFLSLLLGLVMIVAILAGCTGQATTTPTTGGGSTTKATTAATTTAAATTQSNLINTESMVPVVNEPVSMTMAVTVGPMNEDPNDMWFFKYFEEQTKVHWDFMIIQSAAWAEKKPIMMATDEYPDVFFGQSFSSGEIMKYGYDGTFVPLNDQIEQYGDQIKDKMDKISDSWLNITCPDGNIYGLPSLTLGYYFTDNRSWINKKWLDNVGLGVPATLDDFYNVLKAFKENDANGDGNATNQIPWSGAWEKSSAQRMMILNAYGFATNGDMGNNIALDSAGKAVYIPLTETYKTYLTFMNKCYTDKLLDQDVFSQDDVQLKAKGAEGLIGACAYPAPFLLDPTGHQDWVAMAMVAKAGDKPVVYKSSSTSIGRYIVTKKCEHPDVAVRWANLFYDPQFAYYIMYGPEYGTAQDPDGIGTNVKFDDEGYMVDVVTPGWNPDEMGLWDYYSLNHPVNSNFNFGIDDSYIFAQLYKSPKTVAELTAYHKKQIDTGEGNLNEAYWRYNNLITAVPNATNGYPTIYIDEAAQSKVDELKTPLEDFVKSWEAKFITGAASIETDYATFLTELEKLGAQEYQQIYIDAYKK